MTDDEMIKQAQSLIFFAAARKSPGWKMMAEKWQAAYRKRQQESKTDDQQD